MKRTRIITLLVVLALALSVVAPAFAYEPQSRIPWRQLAEMYSAALGLPVWGFFFCDVNTGQSYFTLFPEYSYMWREWPDWLRQEAIDYWNSLPPTNLQYGHCRGGGGVNLSYP